MIMKKSYVRLLLSIFILSTEAVLNSRINTDIYNSLVNNNGWKYLKDVKCIQYWQQFYSLENHLEITTPKGCNKRIRILTLLLACTYAKDLKILFFIIIQFGEHCKSLNDIFDSKATGYDCTVELLKILQKMSSIATLMKDTLYVLDNLHSVPWKDGKNNNFILDNILINLEKFNNVLRHQLSLENYSSVTENFFQFIYSYCTNKMSNIECDIKMYCNFESDDIEFLWVQWIKEYRNINDKTLQFYEYLSQKVNLKINSIIIGKFHNLGFRHNRKTLQIGIPLPSTYNTNGTKFFIRPSKTSEKIQSKSEENGRENTFENRWILELIDSLNKDLVNVSELNKELQLIDFPEKDLINVSEPNKELQLINFLEKDLVNVPEPNKELQLIDFLGKGLNPDASYDDISELMETDENRENYTKYL
ncbi:uncharacterized protein LOC126896514 isoform X2 [Daktulosphaira vitifoliae]|uniref:uncharacterized protein LOC126896514 isoform X2 n=1 Tax=Daktulosphaira vitifoliae TaxID=58002 RepID=UPI0021A97F64|nr:uncharacterized protein LOC126896514 isoform X2 [Daktulosphaira vitifoliae]